MGPAVVILVVVFSLCVLAGGLWAGLRRKPRRAPAPHRRLRKAAQIPASRAGSSDTERVMWVIGKMTATPPRKVPADGVLRDLIAKVDRDEFAAAIGREFRTEVTLGADNLGMTVAQFAHYARHLRRGQSPAQPRGRKRSPKVAGDVLRDLPPPLLALASELGVRGEWDLEKSRLHLTKEYMRWNARIHLAGKESERAAVQARLEQIGRLREALVTR